MPTHCHRFTVLSNNNDIVSLSRVNTAVQAQHLTRINNNTQWRPIVSSPRHQLWAHSIAEIMLRLLNSFKNTHATRSASMTNILSQTRQRRGSQISRVSTESWQSVRVSEDSQGTRWLDGGFEMIEEEKEEGDIFSFLEDCNCPIGDPDCNCRGCLSFYA